MKKRFRRPSHLTEKQREMVLLLYTEYSMREIAEALGVSRSLVSEIVQQARRKWRAITDPPSVDIEVDYDKP